MNAAVQISTPDFGGWTLKVIERKVWVVSLDLNACDSQIADPSDIEAAEYGYLKSLLDTTAGVENIVIDNFCDAAFDINPDLDPKRKAEDEAHAADINQTNQEHYYRGRI